MTVTADDQRRVALPETASPGSVFEVAERGDGQYVLVRVNATGPQPHMTADQVRRAIARTPLKCVSNWAELRKLTREP